MSSLIERMIQRTRATQPSGVQPLLPPRFATSALAWQADDASLGLRPTLSPDVHADSPAKDSPTGFSLVEERRAGSPSHALPSRLHRQEAEGVSPVEHRRSGDYLRGGSFVTTQVAKNAPSQDLRVTAAVTQSVEHSKQTSPEPIHSRVSQFAADRLHAVSHPPNVQSPLPNGVHRFTPHNESGEKRAAPDVSITIGHIEVHASQPAAPVTRSPFRPRVSLDDFLSQQSGKQS
jgi:hypothetical protein